MAGPVALSVYGRRMLLERDVFRKGLRYAMLVWTAPPSTKEDPLLLGTRSHGGETRPSAGAPVVYEIYKNATNAMPGAVTVGRTPNNDLVIEDNSVSRFHGYLVQAPNKVWSIVDADSTQGTSLNGGKLAPKSPAALKDQDVLKLGDVTLTYFGPEAFFTYLDQMAHSSR